MAETIFALSSGSPPAAIAVIRISGPGAGPALRTLAGTLPAARQARVATLRDPGGEMLDRALVLWLPGPNSATGEDTAELHLHGGRAVVAAVQAALAALPGLRAALPGEFTRRAFLNGRIDLTEAEGLADLLAAETELQRKSALAAAAGKLSGRVTEWRDRVLLLSAQLEAQLDFSDDDDVGSLDERFTWNIGALCREMAEHLAMPRAELLREGFRVVLAGPPNAGKSTLFNALVDAEAAITSPQAGTTRDVLSRPVSLDGVPYVFLDTAGLRDDATDPIERIGVERAQGELDRADLVLWLGPPDQAPPTAWIIAAKADLSGNSDPGLARHCVSARTGAGMADLRRDLVQHARSSLPLPGEAALNRGQADLVREAHDALAGLQQAIDPLLVAEHLRLARVCFDRLLGRATTEDMLDALFSRFCIGK